MKIFRLVKAWEMRRIFKVILDMLTMIFPNKVHYINQLLPLIMTGIKFVLMMHFIACGWILMLHYAEETEWIVEKKGLASNYVDAVYFMVSTISTVGYGDISGRLTNEPMWIYEMLYMTIAIVFTILLFSLVLAEVFSYRSLSTVKEILDK